MFLKYCDRNIYLMGGVWIVSGSNLEFATRDDAIAFVDGE